MRLTLLSSAILALLGSTAEAKKKTSSSKSFLAGHLDELPDTGEDWITQADGSEFQPSPAFLKYQEQLIQQRRDKQQRNLKQSTSGYENIFVDGSGSYYNDYAQAWRLLGFYIDCNAPLNNVNECSDGNGGGGGNEDGEAACQRYLLWAAYVDLDYSGGGIGEYQFYDRHAQEWDTTSCIANNGRCAKMDCHLRDSNFQLLGFFKEPNYHEWMEQLFKHQGVCLWDDTEYNFMQTDRYLWPCYCTSTGITDEDGNTLYYDTKPMPEGRIGLGLYTDSRCKFDYLGEKDILEVLESGGGDKNEYGSVSSLQQGIEDWNNAFDVFKVCQPCKAYDLGYNPDLGTGSRRDGGEDDDGAAPFNCYDDADYVNVNQCMKFKTKTEMLAADFRDLMLAHEQGNIVQFEVMGKTYGYGGYRTDTGTMIMKNFDLMAKPGIPTETIFFLLFSTLFLLISLVLLVKIFRKNQLAQAASRKSMKVPLMTNKAGVSA